MKVRQGKCTRSLVFRSSKSMLVASSALLSLSLVAPSHAQDNTSESEVSAQRADNSNEIIVEAQRRSQRLSEVPLTVQAASGETLVNAGITDAASIQRVSAAVSFSGGYSVESTTLAIRGVQSKGDEGGLQPSVAVVIDGMPVARQAEFIVDLADIDRIEVLSGPQGTLFGKNSTGGVVNIISKNPTYEPGMTGLFEFTDDKEVLARAAVNTPLSPNAAVRVNGYYRYSDPLVDNLSGPDVIGQKSYGAQGKVLVDFAPSTQFIFSANYNRSNSTYGANFIILPNSGAFGDFQRFVFGDVFGRGRDVINQNYASGNRSRSYSLIGELTSDLSEKVTLTSITGYRNYSAVSSIDIDGGPIGYAINGGYGDNTFGYPIETVQVPGGVPDFDYNYWSQELRFNVDLGPLNIVAGGFYQNYEETRYNSIPVIIGRIDPMTGQQSPDAAVSITRTYSEIKDDTWAVFGDATFELTETINLFGGLRYTHEKVSPLYQGQEYFVPLSSYDPSRDELIGPGLQLSDVDISDSKSYDNLSGRAGIQWMPVDAVNLYASYNRGYKGPAVAQGRGITQQEQLLLKPEIAGAFEIGAKLRFMGGRAGLDTSLYYQKVKNIQQSTVIPGTILTSLLNAGDLKTKGFQVDGFIELFEGLTIRSAVVYNDATYAGAGADGEPISYVCGPSATPGVGDCRADGTISLVGRQAIGTPRWKVVSSIDLDRPLNDELSFYARVGYDWRSSIQYSLTQDPLLREPEAGFLDASVGLGSPDDSWRVSIFGRNLTDHYYYNNLTSADQFIGVQFGNISRDFHRYVGIRLQTNM
ncbi:TonB-dependent receptor [Croceicoccus sp. BE223]|uniref:TonB-dependent receptor n=1 Tax=Croceicoccus sp. BE223 TaxID=2817716 RepID=UPI002866D5D0|nr:TonB-dependent receptor [Croceicoccus sp. BE223]MDR7103648.1 iron complex outermembrane receptor protein [Croceicoccus sp. BE223]